MLKQQLNYIEIEEEHQRLPAQKEACSAEAAKHSSYIKTYIISLLILFSPFTFNYFFLKNTGELMDYKAIYQIQKSNPDKVVLFGSSINNAHKSFKYAAFPLAKPKVISLGSSRVLQFQQSFFLKPFYNLGLTASSVQEVIDTYNRLIKFNKPEVMILGVDIWWFNDNSRSTNYNMNFKPISSSNSLHPGLLVEPFKWIYSGRIKFSEYIQLLFSYPPLSNHNIGISGLLTHSGIGSDGSEYWTSKATKFGNKDALFKASKQQIYKHEIDLAYGSTVSELHFQKFLELLKLLRKDGIKVVLFFTPIAPEILAEMKKHNYSYIDPLKRKFKDASIKIYDFLDPTNLSSSDCEFLDGFHGGDILYARILQNIAQNDPDLKDYINTTYLENIINKYTGFAMIPNALVTKDPEVDFLCINCKKQALLRSN